MEIKAEQLEKDIDAIPGVCEDGKKAIKKLFENSFGVKFEEKTVLKIGSVYYSEQGHFVVVSKRGTDIPDSMILIDGSPYGNSIGYSWQYEKQDDIFAYFDKRNPKLVAPSLEEYFRKKFNGKL